MLPHKFGAVFAQTGRPNLKYDDFGKAHDEAPDYYAQFGKYKTQIWLYAGYEGSHPDELIASGRRKLEAIAQSLSEKYGIILTLLRFYDDIEWVDISKERSKATAKAAGMRKKERVEVAGAIHVLDGVSQNDHLEIDKARGYAPEIPTDHARIRHALYSGEYEQRFELIAQTLEKISKYPQDFYQFAQTMFEYKEQLKLHLEVERAQLKTQKELQATMKAIRKSLEAKK